jgi:hypothetical protein
MIQANMPAVDEDDESDDRDDTLGKVIEQVATRLAGHASEWHALESFWRPAVVARTMLSDDSNRAKYLMPQTMKNSEDYVAGEWLTRLLSVLDKELLIEINQQVGWDLLVGHSGELSTERSADGCISQSWFVEAAASFKTSRRDRLWKRPAGNE